MQNFKQGDQVKILNIHTASGDRDLTTFNLIGEVLEIDETVTATEYDPRLYNIVVRDNEGGLTWFCDENLELL